jgi:hypothetical protein
VPARRPTQLPEWATSGANIVEPTSGRKLAGWLPDLAPPAQLMNWWKNLAYRWIAFLADEAYGRRADAVAKSFTTANILSGTHNWHAGAVCDAGATGRVQPRYWVVGDDGAGNTAMAYSDSAGAAWANETGSAQAGSLTRAAAHGTLCMAAGGAEWKLGGTTNANGTMPGSASVRQLAYDRVNNLWLSASSGGIHSSPPTAIAWTQRLTGNALGVVHYEGRSYCVKEDVAGTALVFSSTDGINWASAATFAIGSGTPEQILASSEGVFIVCDDGKLYRSATFGASLTFLDVTPATLDPSGAIVWQELCLPGLYFSHGAADDQWKGVNFSLGVSEALAGGEHGAMAVNGTATAVIFGPTINMSAVSFAP